jgi:hypothetical protein
METQINLDIQAKDGSLTPSKIASTGTFTFPSLEVSAVDKGFLLPRLTTAQRDNIVAPIAGSEIYNTDTNQPEYFDGSVWDSMSGGGGGTPGGSNTQIQFNSSGSFAGSPDFTWDNAGVFRVKNSSSYVDLILQSDTLSQVAFNNYAGNGSYASIALDVSGTNFAIGTADTWPVLIQTNSAANTWKFDETGILTVPGTIQNITSDLNLLSSAGRVIISSNTGSNPNVWAFGKDGSDPPTMVITTPDTVYLARVYDGPGYAGNRANILTPSGTRDIFIGSDNINTLGVHSASVNDASVWIGDDGNYSADASAILDIHSTVKGFLPPRMSTGSRDGIATPATGLQIYNTTTNQPEVWNGSMWTGMGGGSITFPLLASDGIPDAPSYSFTSHPGAGLWMNVDDLSLYDSGAYNRAANTGAAGNVVIGAAQSTSGADGEINLFTGYDGTGTSGGNINLITHGTNTWRFDTTGKLNLPLGPTYIVSGNNIDSGPFITLNTGYDFRFTGAGALSYPTSTQAQIDGMVDLVEGMLIWNGDTNKFNFYDGTAWAELSSVSFFDDLFTYSGSNVFTLTQAPATNSEVVAQNGLVLRPTTDYTVSGTTLTILTSLITGD